MDKIGEQLPAVAITAASLTLVFLGLLIASWESYDRASKASVRQRFRTRAWVSFSGIIFALLAVTFGFVGIGTAHAHGWVDELGTFCLLAWAMLTVAQAVIALRDLK